jgi:predicted RND superfamily exporter protein
MANIHGRIETWFSQFCAWIYQRKYVAITGSLLMVMFLASQLVNLKFDTRDESFFHDDDPILIAYNEFRDRFGKDDLFIIALKPRHGLNQAFFLTLSQLHHELEASVPYLDDINSLVNGRIVRGDGDTLVVEDLLKEPPATDAAVNRILDLIDHYPLYENLIVSENRSIVSILVKAQAVIDTSEDALLSGFNADDSLAEDPAPSYLSNDENREIYKAIHQIVAKYQNRDIDFYFSGIPVFVTELQKGIEKDLSTMLPLSVLIIMIFLFLLFRRISGVIYPLITVVFGLVSTLGIMAIAHIPITHIAQILPMFLMVVGIGDSVHVLTIFYRIHNEINDKREAIIQAMGQAGLPILMTSITTACGLLSFAIADVKSVAQLGYVAPVGVMLAYFYTVIMLPALIAVFPVKRIKTTANGKQLMVDRLFDTISVVVTHRPMLIIGISSIIVIGAGYSALSVRFSHNAMTWFPEKAAVRVSTNLLDTVNGGTVMLEVVIDTQVENGLKHPDFLRRLKAAADDIPKISIHGIKAAKVWSIADVLKETNRALHGDSNDAYTVPNKRNIIAQELILFESSGSDELENLTESTYQIARLSILAPFKDSVLYADYVVEVKKYLDRQFPHETVTLTGNMSLFIQMTKNFILSMAKSYGFALLVITVLMVLMIGSLGVGLMSMVANVVPIICIFGVMGIGAIPLDLATILIGSIVLGLVVDDTIHFLHHFQMAFEKTGNTEAAIRMTLFSTGRALVVTSLVLSGGFFIFTTAYFANTVRFGLLTGCAVLFALVADFFLVPALLHLVYRKKGSGHLKSVRQEEGIA